MLAECPALLPIYQRLGSTVPAGTPGVADAEARLGGLMDGGAPLEVAEALLQVARAHLAQRQPLQAQGPLAEAERLFAQHGEKEEAGLDRETSWRRNVEWIRVQIQMSLGQRPVFARPPEGKGAEVERVPDADLIAYIFSYFGLVFHLARGRFQEKEALALAELIATLLNEGEEFWTVRIFGRLFSHVVARIGKRAEDSSFMDMIAKHVAERTSEATASP